MRKVWHDEYAWFEEYTNIWEFEKVFEYRAEGPIERLKTIYPMSGFNRIVAKIRNLRKLSVLSSFAIGDFVAFKLYFSYLD